MVRRWAAPGWTSGRTGPAPRPAAIKSIFSWLPFYRRAWLPIFVVCGRPKFSDGRKRSASRLTRGNDGVAPSDVVRHQPVNLGRLVSGLVTRRSRAHASPRAYAWSRLMARGALLSCSASGSLRLRARALWDLAIWLRPAAGGSALLQSLPRAMFFEFELKPTSRIGRRALGAKECQLCSAPSARPQPKSSQNLL